jgi:3-hydroxyisobutyrate/3-hydroxypropionate dehydrogenase
MIVGSAVWRAASASSTTARLFSTSTVRESIWGFIGLGAMGKLANTLMFPQKDIDLLQGYPMAKNLRAKIPEADTLIICDTNPKATEKFVEEVGIATSSTNARGEGTRIHIAENPREVAQKSVSLSHPASPLAASS